MMNLAKTLKTALRFTGYFLFWISDVATLASFMVSLSACGGQCGEFANCEKAQSACGDIDIYSFNGGPYSPYMTDVLVDECHSTVTADILKNQQYYGSYSPQYGTITVGMVGPSPALVLFHDVVVCNKGISNHNFVVTESMCQYAVERLTTIDMISDDQFLLNVTERRQDLRGAGCMWSENCKITYRVQLNK